MISRREFLKMCLMGAGAAVFADLLSSEVGRALGALSVPKPPVIYLEAVLCSGNIMSMLNADYPDIVKVIREVVDLRVQYTLMAAEGEQAWDAIVKTAEERAGEYILLVEGTLNTKGNGMYGVIAEENGRPVTSIAAFERLAPKAKYIAAIGTCAAYGGPYAARPNPGGAMPISAFTDRTVVNVPGCPVHPDWAIGTLTHLILFGMPALDQFNRPKVFYGSRVHDLCERRAQFENGEFARHLGEAGCLYRVGCKGPVSFCDVPRRRWGERLNWYIQSNSPCIGCTEPVFPDGMMPFFAHLPNIGTPGINVTARTASYLTAGATGLAIAGHLAASLATGRLTREVTTYAVEQQSAGLPAQVPTPATPQPSGSQSPGSQPPGVQPPPGLDPTLSDPDERRRRIETALGRVIPSTPSATPPKHEAHPQGDHKLRPRESEPKRRPVRRLTGRRPAKLRVGRGDNE